MTSSVAADFPLRLRRDPGVTGKRSTKAPAFDPLRKNVYSFRPLWGMEGGEGERGRGGGKGNESENGREGEKERWVDGKKDTDTDNDICN